MKNFAKSRFSKFKGGYVICTIVSQPSKCLKFVTFLEGYFVIRNWMQVLKWSSWDFLSPLILQNLKEDNISQLGNYDAPFYEQQYTYGSCYISLFKFKSFDQLIPPPNCLKFKTFTQLWHYSMVLCLSSGLAKNNKIVSCLSYFPGFFWPFWKCLKWGGGGSLRNLSKNIIIRGWLKVKLVCRGEGGPEDVTTPAAQKILIIHKPFRLT